MNLSRRTKFYFVTGVLGLIGIAVLNYAIMFSEIYLAMTIPVWVPIASVAMMVVFMFMLVWSIERAKVETRGRK